MHTHRGNGDDAKVCPFIITVQVSDLGVNPDRIDELKSSLISVNQYRIHRVRS